MSEGWIKLHRKILENPIFKCEPFSKGQAWIAILMLTNHKPSYIPIKNGGMLRVERGQCGFSEVALAEMFMWSRGKVKRFLTLLKNEKMIQQKIVENHSIIEVLNYDRYQPDTTNDTTNDTTDGHKQECKECREESSSSKTTNNVVYIGTTHFDVYGSYSNVYLSKRQYGALLTQSGSEKLLAILIDELSENIASKSDKDKVFDEKHPDMHYIRLTKYLKNYLERKRKEQPNEPRPYRPYG